MCLSAGALALVIPLAEGAVGCDLPCPPSAILEGEACGSEINRGCFGAPAGGSNCCYAHDSAGCDNPRCEAVVCANDSFCCPVIWDAFCAAEALKQCPELCAGSFVQAWTPLAVGDTVCGSSWMPDDGYGDVDWFEITLRATTELVLTLSTGLPLELSIVDNDGVPDCTVDLEWEPVVLVSACGSATLTACLEAGTHWIVVRPAVDGGHPCGSTGSGYVLEVAAGTRTCELPDPINDTCGEATPLSLGANLIDTHDAATERGGPPLSCLSKGVAHRDVWHEYLATSTGTLRMSACGTADFGALIAVYEGDCEALAELACSHNSDGCTWFDPEIDLEVVEGKVYLIRIGGVSDTDGSLELTLSYLPCRPVYELQVIEPLVDHLDVSPSAIAPSGEIAGLQSNSHGYAQGFRWTPETGYQVVAPVPSSSAGLDDVNGAGTAVGWIIFSPSLISPAIAEGLKLEQLPGLPGHVVGRARGINESGVIVGELASSATCSPTPVQWVDRVPSALPVPLDTDRGIDINDLGNICGTGRSCGASYQEGWVLIDGRFQWIPSPVGDADVFVRAINNVDQVCGELAVDNQPTVGTELGFVWESGDLTLIEPPAPYDSTDVYDITDSGVIVGHLDATSGAPRPYVRRGEALVPINSRLLQLEEPLLSVQAIAEDGVIIGTVGDFDSRPARLVPVPPNGDLNCDGFADAADLGLVLAAWGECPRNTACGEDMNVDGVVDGADVGIVLANWGVVR